MKKAFFVLIGIAAGSAIYADETGGYAEEARGLVKQYFSALKTELQGGMKEGGPVNAIGLCNIEAPAIAARVSEQSEWDVGRTSLKLRNPANAPDAWEKGVLDSFESRKAAGEDVKKMEATAVVDEDGKRVFRYMKAIPTAELCLLCHGAQVPADVEVKLSELYPGDQARGFAVGDIRGAFTLKKDL